MTKERKALQMCLEYIETNAHERKYVRHAIKEALAEPEQVKYRRGDWLRCLETEDFCVVHVSGSANQWVKFPDGDVLSFTNAQVTELFDKVHKEQWTPEDEMAYRPGGLPVVDWEGVAADQAMTIALMRSEQQELELTIKQTLIVKPVGFVGARELARIKDFDITLYARGGFDNAIPLYTAPPKREWVELDAEHMDEITSTAISMVDAMLLTETKLKELNT